MNQNRLDEVRILMTRTADKMSLLPSSFRWKIVDSAMALVLTLIACGQNIQWVKYNRFGLTLTIDEAGYISQAIAYANALKYGGITEWLKAFTYPTKFAPLSPIASSVLMARLGINEHQAFYTHIIFFGGIIFLTYCWVRCEGSRLSAIVAAVLVATLPDIVFYTRTYQYGIPTAFFFLLANFAYYKSRRFDSWFWSILVGAALGLMLMSRTMSIAFLPAFGLAWLIDSRQVLRENLFRICISIVVFFLLCAPWYIWNAKDIFGYLFSFGYGVHSTEYGGTVSILSLAYLFSKFQELADSLYLIHLLLVFIPFLGGVFLLVRQSFVGSRTETDARLAPTLVLIIAIAILFSSRNRGSGFDVPLYPVMIFCSMCALSGFLANRILRVAILVLLLASSLWVGHLESASNACAEGPRMIIRPFLGSTQKRICDSFVEQYIRGVDEKPGEDRSYWGDISYADQREWRQVSDNVAVDLKKVDSNNGMVLYATRNRLVNVNTVMLSFIGKFAYILPATQIDPQTLDDTYETYRNWFHQAPQGSACTIVMLSNVDGDSFPRSDLDLVKKIVAEDGFKLVTQVPTPDAGTFVNLWTSEAKCSAGEK